MPLGGGNPGSISFYAAKYTADSRCGTPYVCSVLPLRPHQGVLTCYCSSVCTPSAVRGDDLLGDSGHVSWNHHCDYVSY